MKISIPPSLLPRANRTLRLAVRSAFVFFAYFVSARFGLGLDAVSGLATLIWAPTGIAIATLLLGGNGLWPAIALGAWVVNVRSGAPPLLAVGIAFGNTAEAILGAQLLRRVHFHPAMDRLRDIFLFVAAGVTVGPVVSATVGVFCLWATGWHSFEGFVPTWRAWWLGDALGAFVVAPLILVWANELPTLRFRPARLAEALLLAGLLAGSAYFVRDAGTLAFWLFPFVVWATLRFGQVGAVSTVFLLGIISVLSLVHGEGMFAGHSLRDDLLLLPGFLFIIGTTAITLAASLTERTAARTERELARRRLQLQYDVMSAVAEADSSSAGLQAVLRVITEALDWELGAFYGVDDEANRLRGRYVWRAPRASLEEFAGATLGSAYAPGVGLPGRAWETRSPAWVVNVAVDPNFPRAPLAARYGLHGAFAFPISSRERVIGVMEFFCREVRARDEELLRAIAISGVQIGQFIERMAAEESLRHAVRARDEFLSIASHELKTPLTSLSLQVQMTRRRTNPETGAMPSAEKLAQTLGTVERQVDRLKRLVEDLLDASRIQTGKFSFHFEWLDLSFVVSEMVERFAAQLQRTGNRLELSVQPGVRACFDPVRIEQVLDNFLTNALKYAPGRPLRVSLREEDGHALLIFRDHGPGIPADKQARIFERFERATEDRGVSGLGLGLFIVREIARGHGGEVTLRCPPDGGTEFSFRFPLGHPPGN